MTFKHLGRFFMSLYLCSLIGMAFTFTTIYAEDGKKKNNSSTDGLTSASGKFLKKLKQEDIDFLMKNKSGFFATIEKNKPRVRPWGLHSFKDGKLIFVTGNNKPVYNQLKREKYAEWISMDPETMASLRIFGKVTFINDEELKKKTITESPFLTKMYGGEKSKTFEMFSMNVIETHFFAFPPKPQEVAKDDQ